jgi:hypothetical protein
MRIVPCRIGMNRRLPVILLAGTTCKAPLVLVNGVCTTKPCGDPQLECCVGAQKCKLTSLTCVDNRCVDCGGEGEPICTGVFLICSIKASCLVNIEYCMLYMTNVTRILFRICMGMDAHGLNIVSFRRRNELYLRVAGSSFQRFHLCCTEPRAIECEDGLGQVGDKCQKCGNTGQPACNCAP